MNTGTKVENQKIEKKNSKENRTQKKRSPTTNQTRKRKLRIVDTLSDQMSAVKPAPPVPPVATRFNETIVDVLGRLATMMTKKGDYIRSRAYTKAQDTVLSITTDITDIDQLKGKPNIGPTILEKLKEYVSTGTLRLFEREKDNPEYILSEVYGIGPKKAHELVAEKGVRSIVDLRARQDELLNETQKMGLHYYEDILEKVPRSEIDVYNTQFGKAFDKSLASHPTQTSSNYEIVGSYRRGATVSGDIDVIVTSNVPAVFVSFVDALISAKIIIEVLSRGKTKCLVIARLPGHKVARRVDFMFTSPEEYPFAVLYFTGSKGFNTVMRGHALKRGLSLNEHGLYKKLPGKEKEEKIDTVFRTERDIFDHLHLVYKNPVDRIDGRAVVNEVAEIVPVVPLPNTVVPVVTTTEPVITLKRSSKKTDIKTSPHTITIKKRGMKSVAAQSVAAQSVAAQSVAAQKGLVTTNQRIGDFKANGISVLEKLNEKELSEMIVASNDAYYNTKTHLLTDNEYDIVKEYIETRFPKNEVIQQVGAPVTKNKVTLPYNMPSMDKIKPDTNALTTWMTKYKGPYTLSCKLDGVSGMYDCTGKEPKLYTRGDGKVGQNITGLLPHLRLPGANGFVIRGEFIIPKAVFDTKYKETFANPRNLVSGIINSKTMDSKIGDIHFVVYEIIHPQLKPSEQMKKLTDLGFEVVQHRSDKVLTNASLSETLMDWRSNYKYEIDGVIVSDDNVYPRKEGNPEHAFAFKMVISDQMAEAKVVDVEWAASKSGYLKPRIRIEPIRLGGVTIEYCTAFNGNFVETNKIGIGAVIQIIRSGDVIPYIQAVTSPASHPKMPTIPYHWNDTHVDIILDDVTSDETVLLKNITAFFVELEVDGLSAGNVKRIMNAGFNTVPNMLKMTRADFAKVEGFKEKMVTKIYEGIKTKVESATLLQVMVASNLFGRGIGERKIRPVMEKYPAILTSPETPAQKTTMLLNVPGIGKEQSKLFVDNIPRFLAFLKECGLEGKLSRGSASQVVAVPETTTAAVDKTNPLYGKKIVMTKIRDKEIIEYMKTVGATLEEAIKKDTFVLIVKSKSDVSNKTKYAYDNSIPIMEPAEFKERFMS